MLQVQDRIAVVELVVETLIDAVDQGQLEACAPVLEEPLQENTKITLTVAEHTGALRGCLGFGFWAARAIFRRLRARFIGP